MKLDKTLVLAGTKPKRVRLRVLKKKTLEQTTWNAKGLPKVTKKSFADAVAAAREFDKALHKKLRDDYAVLGEAKPGNLVLEAFAGGGGGGAVLDMSLDGSLILTASITNESNFGVKLELIEVASGARRVVMEERGGATQNFLHAALFDRDAKSIYVALRDETFRLELGTNNRKPIARVKDAAFNPFVVRPNFDTERKRLVVFDEMKTPIVRVLDEADKPLLDVSTTSKTTECRGAAISPSGRVLALYIASRGIVYGHADAMKDTTNEVQLWDIEAGAKWETVTIPQKLRRVGLTPDDETLLVTGEFLQGPIAVEIPSAREKWKLMSRWDNTELARTEAWAYSPDGKQLAIATSGLALLDATSRNPVLELEAMSGRVDCPRFSRDGKRLAAWIGGSAVVFAL